MTEHQKLEWRKLVEKSKTRFSDANPSIEDEVVVAADRDMQLMYNALHYIANNWIEPSFDGVMKQRRDLIKVAKTALKNIEED